MNLSESELSAIENIRRSVRENSSENIVRLNALEPYLTTNDPCLYEALDENMDLIFQHLDNKHLLAKNTSETVNTTGKKLLYFSVFLNQEYLDLLELCLKSIVAYTNLIDFDVLIITDDDYYHIIRNLSVLNKFNVSYMITPPVNTPQEASIRKLHIFDYEKINNYEKILYFDADILCVKDLNIIFNKQIVSDKLYVSFSENLISKKFFSPHHGLMYFSFKDAKFLSENPQIRPFNAGQFFFKNSNRMKLYFENVRWLIAAWPGKYFYEQSSINQYFVFNELTEPLVDGNENQLIGFTQKKTKVDDDDIVMSKILNKYAIRPRTMFVSGASNSAYSREEMLKRREGKKIKEELSLTESETYEFTSTENIVAVHFVSTFPSAPTKKKSIENYINAHKLHI